MKTRTIFFLWLLCSPFAQASAVEEQFTPEIRKEMGESFRISPQWFIYDRLIRSDNGNVTGTFETKAVRYEVAFPASFRDRTLSNIILEIGNQPNLVSCDLFRIGEGKEPRKAYFTIDPAQVANSRIVIGYAAEENSTQVLVSIPLKSFLADDKTPPVNITGRK